MMSFFSSFHFIRPFWLLAFIPALWFIVKNKSYFSSTTSWSKVIDKNLLPFLLKKNPQKNTKVWLNKICLPLFLCLLILSLSGPTWKKVLQNETFNKQPLIILLELSDHMLSTDLSPSRLTRAKYKIEDLLKEYSDGQIALVAFAGDAHVVTPATKDHKTLVSLLKDINPSIMPVMGVSFISALKKAQEIGKNINSSKVLVVTSSNLNEIDSTIVTAIKKSNLEIFFWCFATKTGAPLTDIEGRFGKGENNSITISRLDQEKMKSITMQTSSKYVDFMNSNADVAQIINFAQESKVYLNGDAIKYDDWLDVGPYLLALSLVPFLVLFFSPSAMIMVLLFCFVPKSSNAFNFFDIFLRDDQKAQKLLDENKPQEAAKLFTTPEQKGASYFKAKDYENAILELKKSTTSDGKYNLGNAYAHLGKIEEAIKAYEESLKIDPKNEDAKFNKELLEKKKQEQQQEQKNSQENQEQEQNKDKQDKQENKQDEKSSEQKQQENQNQSSKKEQKEKQDQQQDSAEQKDENKNEKNAEHKEKEEKKEQPSHTQKNDEALKKEEEQEHKEMKPAAKEDEKHNKESKAEYYFEKVEKSKNQYLKRKFLYETRENKGQ